MPTPPSPDTPVQSSPGHKWLDLHGDYLFGYAALRLRNPDAAERAVLETLIAAEDSKQRFTDQSAERKWLREILKDKIIDYYRKSSQARKDSSLQIASCPEHDPFQGPHEWLGHWRPELAPRNWRLEDSAALEKENFWPAFNSCLGHLPEMAAMAYTLREVDGLSVDEICDVLNVTSGDLATLLQHARLELRIFVETEMFRGEPASPNAPITKAMVTSDDHMGLPELKDAFKFAALVRPRNLLNVEPLQNS